MEELKNEMVEEIAVIEDDFDVEDFEDSDHGNFAKIGLIGLAAAAAAGGLAIAGKKFVAPKLKAAKTNFKDWREAKKEAKAEKKAKKEAGPEYIEVEAIEVKDSEE